MDTKDRVTKIIKKQLYVKESEIKPEANLADDLGADSLDIVEIVMEIEEEFGIEISYNNTENVKTVSDVINYIDDALKNHIQVIN